MDCLHVATVRHFKCHQRRYFKPKCGEKNRRRTRLGVGPPGETWCFFGFDLGSSNLLGCVQVPRPWTLEREGGGEEEQGTVTSNHLFLYVTIPRPSGQLSLSSIWCR